jgi:hypothetical protein
MGNRATCLLRDRAVVTTGWTDAPIPWPQCHGIPLSASPPSTAVTRGPAN